MSFLATDASFRLQSKSAAPLAQEEEDDFSDMPALEEVTSDDGAGEEAGPVHCARCHASVQIRAKM